MAGTKMTKQLWEAMGFKFTRKTPANATNVAWYRHRDSWDHAVYPVHYFTPDDDTTVEDVTKALVDAAYGRGMREVQNKIRTALGIH